MDCIDIIKEIIDEYKKKLGINEEVKVKIKEYKARSAFVNLKTRTIYINKVLLELGREVIEYLILHELIHIKLNSKYHHGEYHKILYAYMPPEKISEIRGLISSKLLATYNRNKSAKHANHQELCLNNRIQ